MNSMLAYFDVVVPFLPPALVAPPAIRHLRALQTLLPPCDLAGFECRLEAEETAVDFTVRVPSGAFAVPPPWRDHPVWAGVDELCTKLMEKRSALAGRVNVIDLEFDLPGDDVPVPAIFFDLQRERPLGANELQVLACELTGRAVSPAVARTLGRAVHALPPSGRIIHLGAMRSRNTDALRVVVSRVPPGELLSYLDAAGWHGDRSAVAAALEPLSALAGSLAVSLDIGAEVGSRIGIETFIDPIENREAKWRAILDWFVAHGACTEEKARAALSWSGVSRPDAGQWPASLTWGDRLLRGRAVTLFARFLSHLKVVVDVGRPLQGKAYFGFAHYWAEPAATQAAAVGSLA